MNYGTSSAITSKSLHSKSFTICDNIPKNPWILDFGFINHMTFDSILLFSYTSPSSIYYITIFRDLMLFSLYFSKPYHGETVGIPIENEGYTTSLRTQMLQ